MIAARRWVAALAFASALLGFAATAAASEPPPVETHTVLVLPLEAEGVLDGDRTGLRDRLSGPFEHPEITLVQAGEVEPCSDDACLRTLGRERGATHVVRAFVVADGRDYVAQIVVLSVDQDGPANVIDAGCEICGVAEFGDRLAARSVAARDLILAEPQLGRIEVVGTPADARLRIDGKPRGHLPYRGPLSVGPHELKISAAGHYPQVVPIEALAGVAKQLDVNLELKPLTERRRGLGWGLLGGGVGAFAAGSALIGVHGSPASLRCAGDASLVDADGDCRWLRRTLGFGVGLAVVGAAAAATGVSFLIIDSRRRQAHERAIPRAAEVSARFGWSRVDLKVRF